VGDLPLTGSPHNPIVPLCFFFFFYKTTILPTCTYRRRFAQLNLIWSIPTKGRSSQLYDVSWKRRDQNDKLFDKGAWPLWPAPVTFKMSICFLFFICKRLKEDLRLTRSLLNRPDCCQSGLKLQEGSYWSHYCNVSHGRKKSANHSQVTAILNCLLLPEQHTLCSLLCPCFCFSLLISATETSHTKKKIIPESTQSRLTTRCRMSGRRAHLQPCPTSSSTSSSYC